MMSAFLRVFLMIFVCGLCASAFARTPSVPAPAARESAATLHLPWPLFESELQAVVTQENAPWRSALPDTTVEVGGLNWSLSGVRVDAQVAAERPLFDGSRLFVRASKLSMRLGVDRLSISQVVEREIGGVIVRVHINASCGPIRLVQEQAQTEAGFALDWSTGEPVARLGTFGLAWTPGTWSVSEFSCEGPQGFGDMLRDEIIKRTKEPAELKPLISDWIAREVQSRLQTALGHVKQPLTIATGEGRVPMKVGRMQPASTGLLIDVVFGDAPEGAAPVTAPVPADESLAKLPKDAPIFLGKMDVLEHLIGAEMGARDPVTTVDLRTFSSFKTLLGSRFLQFFLWQDLFNYSSSSPFYLRLKTPTELAFSLGRDGTLTTNVPLQAVVQSYRDDQWWDYVAIRGQAKASVKVSLDNGRMTASTSLSDPRVDIGYADAYVKRYRPGGWLPTSSISSAIEGPQSMLSGSWPWPDVDLGVAGKYRAQRLQWLDTKTFAITWGKLAE